MSAAIADASSKFGGVRVRLVLSLPQPIRQDTFGEPVLKPDITY